MNFDSDDTKKLPFQVEIRRKGISKPYNNSGHYSKHVAHNQNKIKEQEVKNQIAQENIENLKKSLPNPTTNNSYVNPLKAAFLKREEEQVLAEKKRQEQQTQKLLYQEYKRKQEAFKAQKQNYINNSNAKKSVVAPRFSHYSPTNNPNINSNSTTNVRSYGTNNNNTAPINKLNIYNTGAMTNVTQTFNNTPKQQYNKKTAKETKRKKVLKAVKDDFDWKKYVGDDGNENIVKNRKSSNNKIKDKNTNIPKEMITITKDMTLGSLSHLISVPLDRLMRQAQEIGVDQDSQKVIDKDALFLILDMNGFGCHIYGTEESFNDYLKINKEECKEIRPPVICVMGHVDHGKTSFLDKIRESRVVDIEAGGITQNITLWQLDQYGKAIFIDTPGHSVFSIMRKVGLNLTDIVILLIAGDDGVKDQTIEILKAIQIKKNNKKANPINIIVGITKVDKLDKATKEKNLANIYNEISKYDLVPESYGGDIKVICISNKTGEGIKEMLECIEATKGKMSEALQYNQNRHGIGIVVNAYMEKGMGAVAYVLLKQGTLKIGDKFISGKISGKVRLILSPNSAKNCTPNNIIKITGFNDGMPHSGDDFIVMEDENLMKNVLLVRNRISSVEKQESLLNILNTDKIDILLKTDTMASLEALELALINVSHTTNIKIFSQSVGNVMLSDVEMAEEFGLVIVGFNTKIDTNAAQLVKITGVKYISGNIIYRILEDMEMLTKKTEVISVETLVGTCEVRHIFTFNKIVISGCRVLDGSIFHSIHHICEIFRDTKSIYKGSISSMKKEKDNIKEAKQGIDVGIIFDGFNDIQIKDIIKCYHVVVETKVIEG